MRHDCHDRRDRRLEPSEQDVEFYNEHGWFIARGALALSVIHEAVRYIGEFYEGDRDREPPISLPDYLDWRKGMRSGIRMNDFVLFQSDRLKRLVNESPIGAIAGALADTNEIRLLNSELISKDPVQACDVTTEVGWHADKAYWKTSSSDKLLTAWIPLQNTDGSLGGLRVADCTHVSTDNAAARLRSHKTFRASSYTDLHNEVTGLGNGHSEVELRLNAGDVSFHNCNLLHRSLANSGARTRTVLILHLQDLDNEYVRTKDTAGTLASYKIDPACRKLADGNPDYRDPRVCPVLWRKSGGFKHPGVS